MGTENENQPPRELTDTIEGAILQGATRAVVENELKKRAAANASPMPSPDEINAAYAAIVERWLTDANQTDDEKFAYHVRLRKHLYLKSFQLNDFKNCLAIAADLRKIEERHLARASRAAREERSDQLLGTGAQA